MLDTCTSGQAPLGHAGDSVAQGQHVHRARSHTMKLSHIGAGELGADRAWQQQGRPSRACRDPASAHQRPSALRARSAAASVPPGAPAGRPRAGRRAGARRPDRAGRARTGARAPCSPWRPRPPQPLAGAPAHDPTEPARFPPRERYSALVHRSERVDTPPPERYPTWPPAHLRAACTDNMMKVRKASQCLIGHATCGKADTEP